MLDQLIALQEISSKNTGSQNVVLKMVSHDRMGGSVPVWEASNSARAQTAQRFMDVLQETTDKEDPSSDFLLSLASDNTDTPKTDKNVKDMASTPFGFVDLIDMVNPLHHIPVVGTIYREFTGDQIRGPGRVIGGALFGGIAGAASSFVNMIVEYDTGRDLGGHAMDMVRKPSATTDQSAQNNQNSMDNINPPAPQISSATLTDALLAYDSHNKNEQNGHSYIRTLRL